MLISAYSTLTDLDYGQDLLKLNIVKNFPEEIRCRNIILEWYAVPINSCNNSLITIKGETARI